MDIYLDDEIEKASGREGVIAMFRHLRSFSRMSFSKASVLVSASINAATVIPSGFHHFRGAAFQTSLPQMGLIESDGGC